MTTAAASLLLAAGAVAVAVSSVGTPAPVVDRPRVEPAPDVVTTKAGDGEPRSVQAVDGELGSQPPDSDDQRNDAAQAESATEHHEEAETTDEPEALDGPEEDVERDPVEHSATAQRLWGRTFTSVEVRDDTRTYDLVGDTQVEVTFEYRDESDEGVVRWWAGCNTHGSQAHITDTHVRTVEIGGTDMDCDPARQRQDDWLNDFFAAGPAWRLDDEDLALRVGDTVIEFREGAAPRDHR